MSMGMSGGMLYNMLWSNSLMNRKVEKVEAPAPRPEILSVANLRDARWTEEEAKDSLERAFKGSTDLVKNQTYLGHFCKIDRPTHYWCRESCMSNAESDLFSKNANDLVHMIVYSAKEVGEEVVQYLNKIEKEYDFKGTHSSLIYEKDIPKKYLRNEKYDNPENGERWNVPECGVFCLRIADEWYKSPTLQQMCSLFVRLLVMRKNGQLSPDSFDLSKWVAGGDLTSPWDEEALVDTDYEWRSYPRDHYTPAKKYLHMLLSQREVLFSNNIKYEWTPTKGKTEYGMQVLHPTFSRSGTTSFAKGIRYYSNLGPVRHESSVDYPPYFKFKHKYKMIEQALKSCGMTMEYSAD